MLRAHARKLARRLVSSSSLVARSASSIEHIHASSSALYAKKNKKPITHKRIANKNTKLVVPYDAEKDHWKAIIDEESDKIYYWNTKTNETTRLGDPKPSSLSSPTDAQRSRNRQLKNRKDDDALFVPSDSSDVRADANGIAVQMGTVFLFGIGAAFGVTFVAAAFGFR